MTALKFQTGETHRILDIPGLTSGGGWGWRGGEGGGVIKHCCKINIDKKVTSLQSKRKYKGQKKAHILRSEVKSLKVPSGMVLMWLLFNHLKRSNAKLSSATPQCPKPDY